jgi:hypothetical protein
LTVSAGDAGAASGGSFTLGSYGGSCLNGVSASTTATWISNLKVNSDKTISGAVGTNTSTSERTATIKVTATECTSGKTFTYKQNGTEVTCPTQSNIINTNTTVVNSGGTQVEVMQILKDSTYTAYTITATSTSSSYVSNVNQGDELHDDWYVVLADVTANPNTSDRSLYFDVVVKGPTLGTGCTYSSVTVTQNGGCPTVYNYGSTIPTEGSPMGLPLMYWSPSDDYPLNTFSVSYTGDGITSTEFITSSSLIPGQTVNVLLVKFSANTGTSSRTFNIHLSTSVSSDCTWDNTYTQEGATQTCDCNAITYSGTYEADPTVPTQTIQFTLKINNTTNNIVYFDEGVINFNNGVSKTINPGCEGVNGNETKAIGMFTLYNAPDPATIASATIEASHQSKCSGYAVTSVTPDITTLTNGCTLTLTYNG